MTLNEAKEEIDVASGTFLLNEIHAKILFDSGVYHSFISHEFGRRIKLSLHRLGTPIMIEVASGRNVADSNRLESVIIELK